MATESGSKPSLALKRVGGTAVGYLAGVLGSVGSVLALAAAVAVIWFGLTAPAVVEQALTPVNESVDRLEDRLDEATAAVENAGGTSELQARIQGVADVAADAEQRLEVVEDHPVLGQLPVDTAQLSDLLRGVTGISAELNSELTTRGQHAVLATVVQTRITGGLDEAASQLAAVDDRIVEIEDQLRTWIRLAALLGVLACLWGLWSQLVLAHWGWRTARPAARAMGTGKIDTTPSATGRQLDDAESSPTSAPQGSPIGERVHAFVVEPGVESTGEPSALSTLAEQLIARSNGAITVNVNVAVDDRPAGSA